MPILNIKQAAQLKTEQQKIDYIKSLIPELCPTDLRKEVGKIWGIGKSARNEKYNKLAALAKKDKGIIVLDNGSKIYTASGANKDKIRGLDPKKLLKVNGDKAVAEVKGSKIIYTLEELIEVCGINMDEWTCTRFTGNSYGDNFQAKAEFAKKKEYDAKKIIESLKSELLTYSPHVNPIHAKSVDNNDLMLELVLADVHLGRLCWRDADGDSYDLKIARELVFSAVYDMVEKAKRFGNYSKVVLWIAGDYLNVDNEENTTTALTAQSVDSRFPKVFKEGKDILIEVINFLKQIAPVDVIVTRGNHDYNSMFHMGEVMEAYFHNDKNVNIDNSPAPRKYYKFGKNLILFCHGDKIDLKKLPAIMAAERASDWGSTKWHECHTAHRHHEKLIVDESAQCKTRVMNTIAGVDGYHASHGYVQNIRCAQSFVWSKDYGLQSLVYSKAID